MRWRNSAAIRLPSEAAGKNKACRGAGVGPGWKPFFSDASLPVYEGQLFSNLNDGWTRGYCPASADWLKNWGVRSKQSSMLVNERNDPILCRHDLLLRWNSCNIMFLKRISTLARPNPNRRAPITLTSPPPRHRKGSVHPPQKLFRQERRPLRRNLFQARTHDIDAS
jgi:hypothetical protein